MVPHSGPNLVFSFASRPEGPAAPIWALASCSSNLSSSPDWPPILWGLNLCAYIIFSTPIHFFSGTQLTWFVSAAVLFTQVQPAYEISNWRVCQRFVRLKKLYLIAPCLTISIIRYGSRRKWSNLGKGVVAPEKGSFGSPLTTVTDFIYIYIYIHEKTQMYMNRLKWILTEIDRYEQLKIDMNRLRYMYMKKTEINR